MIQTAALVALVLQELNMGSGDKFTVHLIEGCGLGIHFSRFPFSFTINITILIVNISIGFGKGYDE